MKRVPLTRRLLAFLMAAAICFSLVPWTVFAAETDTYTQVTGAEDFTSGQYVLVTDTGYAPGVYDNGKNAWITAVQPAAADGTVTDTAGAVWTLTVDGNTVKLTDANGVTVAPKGGNNNGIVSGDYSWAWSFADGKFTFTGTGSDTVVLAGNAGSENKFRAYKTSTASGNPKGYLSAFTAYKLVEQTGDTDPSDPAPSEPAGPSEPVVPEVPGWNDVDKKYDVYELVTAPADGDVVVLYNPGNGKALSSEDAGYYKAGVEASLAGEGYIASDAETIAWTASVDENGLYSFTQGEKKLGVEKSGNYINLKTNAGDYGFVLTAFAEGGDLYRVRSATVESSYGFAYLEWYAAKNAFSAYATGESKATEKDFGFRFYKLVREGVPAEPEVPSEPSQPTDPSQPTEPVVPEEPAGSTATLVTDAASLKAGDQIIIVASGSDFALSTNQKSNNRGQAAVTKSEDGTTVTYGEDTQVITLEAGLTDGAFGFNVGNGYLYAASSSSNHLKTESALSANSSWTVEIADGIATVKATGSNTRNWLRHNATSSLFACYGSGQKDISIYKLGGVEEEEPEVPEVKGVADGNYVIWAPAYNMALSSVYNGFYNTGVAVTMENEKLSGYGTSEIWTVKNNEDGTITISCGSGKLSMDTGFSSMPLNKVNDTWTLEEAGEDLWYVKNAVRGSYIEWYASKNNWSGYNTIAAGSEGMFALQFTPAEAAEEPEVKGVADGDYVIWAPAYNKALSSVYGGFYNNGVDVTLNGETLAGYTNAEIWTVKNNEDGTITISCAAGKLSMDTGFSSMPLNKVNDTWTLEEAGNGLWYVKNVGRSAYIEWYADNKYWSGYGKISEGSEGLFALKFTPAQKGFATDSSVVENIAQWGGMTSAENTAFIYGDKYVSGDELDTEDIYTAVVGGKTVTPWTKGGNNDAPLYYMGGAGLGSGSDDYLQLKVNAAGWGDMTLSFRLRASNSGPGSFKLQYSADNGATWQNFSTGSYAYAYTGWTSEGSYPVTGEGKVTDGVAKTSYAPANYVSFVFDVPAGADNCENLLIRLVPGTEKANGSSGAIGATATVRFDTVVLSGSPIVDASVTGCVSGTPGGKEDHAVGTELTMTTATEGAVIYYRVGGGQWQPYDAANKPTLDALPCNIEAYASAEGKANSVVRLYRYAAGTVETVKFSPNGGGIYIEGESSEITLSTATEGAAIYYAVSEDGITFSEFAEYTDPIVVEKGFGKLVIQAYAQKDGYKESNLVTRTFTERTSSAYQIFFGQLHSHTNISDGSGTVEEAFAHASQVKNLDFLAVTDHSNSFDGEGNGVLSQNGNAISSEWKQGHEAAAAVTDEDFVGLYGFEMTWSNGLGHINTFNTPGWQSRTQADYKTMGTALQNYYAALATVPESISQFNHPGTTFGDFSDFAHYSEATDALITLLEVGNGEGAIGSSGYFPSYEYYTRALDKGWHVAPTNNQDNHKGLWGDANTGRSVVLADSLTEEGIYDALRNYRVYATEDNDLNIYYTLNGCIMGSQLEVTDVAENLTISVNVSDATDSAIGKIEVIVNGGLTAASQTLNQHSGTVTLTVPATYNYYYIKITQPDGDIAVTAPVWVGKVEAVGIGSLKAESALTIAGQEQTITAELFNNERSDLKVESLVYTDKATSEVIYTDTGITSLGKESTATSSFGHTFPSDGVYTITATLKGTLNGVSKTYTKDLEITVMPGNVTSRIIVDGTHFNDYVTGYYGGNVNNMTTIAAAQGIQVHVEKNAITPEMLENCSLLVISAPAKKSGTANAGDYVAKPFEDAFIAMVADYVKAGGSVIVCGLADYQDKGAVGGAEGHTAAQLNKLLAALGSTMTINDDEAYDEERNGGQAYRLYPENFNMDSRWCEGILEGQQYSQYSGCTVNPGQGTWLVKGFETTYSIDSDNDGLGGLNKGEAYFLAVEETGFGGNIFVAGGVFVSDFEVKAELDNIWDLPYANRTIYENIIGITRTQPEITPIADVRASAAEGLGRIFVVEGYVTAGTDNDYTTFFDAIYIQDATGGITVFPYSEEGLELGTKVRITGYTDAYQGDIEIQIMSLEILDAPKNVIEPEKVSAKDAMDYENNGGQLLQVEGEVTDVTLTSDGKGVAQFTVKDEQGDEAKIFIDGYILSGTTGENNLAEIVKVGNTVSAVGLLYMHPEGDSEQSVAVLRVRDCDEIVLISEKPAEPETDKTQLEKELEDTKNLKEKDYSRKTWAALQAARKVAEQVLADENATQEEIDAALAALKAAIKALAPPTGSAETSDNTPIGLYLVIMVGSSLALVVLLWNRKRFAV